MFKDSRENITYANKVFDKVVINFVENIVTYLKSRSYFLSKSKLYKYVKVGYMEIVLSSFFIQLFLFISIIVLKLIH